MAIVYLLDNFDSFTYNLVDELACMDFEVKIYRNDLPAQDIFKLMQQETEQVILMLSPGPGNPQQAGCLLELIALAKGNFPIIGICLGHQAIVESYGGDVVKAETIVHGKSSAVSHCGDKMFTGLAQPLPVARYHSLCADSSTMPEELDIIASFNDVVMGVYHPEHNIVGFQFHPESILTTQGATLLQQSLRFLEHGA